MITVGRVLLLVVAFGGCGIGVFFGGVFFGVIDVVGVVTLGSGCLVVATCKELIL
jgi:hypothetical protein